jgi:hypothetical protein
MDNVRFSSGSFSTGNVLNVHDESDGKLLGNARGMTPEIRWRYSPLQEILHQDRFVDPHTIDRHLQRLQRPLGGRLAASLRPRADLLQDMFPRNTLGS